MNFIERLFSSLDNHTLGFSGRKISAMVGVGMGMFITIVKLPIDQMLIALYIWLGFALLCLGIVTIQNLIEFKNGQKANNSGNTPA